MAPTPLCFRDRIVHPASGNSGRPGRFTDSTAVTSLSIGGTFSQLLRASVPASLIPTSHRLRRHQNCDFQALSNALTGDSAGLPWEGGVTRSPACPLVSGVCSVRRPPVGRRVASGLHRVPRRTSSTHGDSILPLCVLVRLTPQRSRGKMRKHFALKTSRNRDRCGPPVLS